MVGPEGQEGMPGMDGIPGKDGNKGMPVRLKKYIFLFCLFKHDANIANKTLLTLLCIEILL